MPLLGDVGAEVPRLVSKLLQNAGGGGGVV